MRYVVLAAVLALAYPSSTQARPPRTPCENGVCPAPGYAQFAPTTAPVQMVSPAPQYSIGAGSCQSAPTVSGRVTGVHLIRNLVANVRDRRSSRYR